MTINKHFLLNSSISNSYRINIDLSWVTSVQLDSAGWNILTCLFSCSLRLLHCVCAHLNICNDKYSWFSYRIVTLPGQWSTQATQENDLEFILMRPPLHNTAQTVHTPLWLLVIIFIKHYQTSAQLSQSSEACTQAHKLQLKLQVRHEIMKGKRHRWASAGGVTHLR